MDDDDFYLKVAHALSDCQIIEQELKLYITEALDLARKCIENKMPFKMDGKDYAGDSLGKLVKTFSKFTDNETLVADLNRLTQERNFLSHKGITHCLDYEGELNHSSASEFQGRLEAIQSEAQRLRLAIHKEASKFQPYLWFDDLTKKPMSIN